MCLLTNKGAEMTIDEAKTILYDYSQVLHKVAHTKTMLTQYPNMVYPISLLPYPKEQIERALNLMIAANKRINDPIQAELLDWSKTCLKRFIEDNEAAARNGRILSSKDYQEKLRKAGWK